MWVYDKRIQFVKDGHFTGNVGMGMFPTNYELSITGDTYMEGNLGINTFPSSYTVIRCIR